MNIFSHLLALLLLTHWAGAASVTLSLPAATGHAGSTVSMPISVRDAQGMGAFQCDVLYPPFLLESTDVKPGTLPTGLFNHKVIEPGRLRIVMAGDSQNPVKGSGTLFDLQFKALPGAAAAPMPIILDRARAWEQNKDSLEMRVITENGSFMPGFDFAKYQWLLIGGGVAVLLLLVLIVRRKKKTPAAADSAN